MKKFLLAGFAFLVFFGISAFAQSTGGSNKEDSNELIFVLKHKFPVNVVHKYYMLDSSTVTRFYVDSVESRYSYQKLTHFSCKAPNRRDEEGFLELRVSIDSLDFSFTDYVTDENTSYNTNTDDDAPPFSFNQFMMSMVPIGKEFFLTYSGYQEVVNIYGERYKLFFDRYDDPETGMKDTIQRFVWLEGVDLDNMSFLADVGKDLLPETGRIAKDSTWRAIAHSKINGVHIIDTVEFVMTKYTSKQYEMKGKSIGMYLPDKRTLPYKYPLLTKAESISGTGEYTIRMTPRGAIKALEAKYDVMIKLPIKNEYITEKVNSNITWILDRRYKY